jgi:hypothetical protein
MRFLRHRILRIAVRIVGIAYLTDTGKRRICAENAQAFFGI